MVVVLLRGLKTSFAASIWPGCSTHLPSKPERGRAPGHPAEAVDVPDLQVGPSMACLSWARAAIRIA